MPHPVRGRARSIEEIQREGGEAWLALRAERQTKGVEQPTPEISRGGQEQSTPALSLDEQRAQAIEAWRKMRGGPAPTPDSGREKGRDQEREREWGLERDGPEIEP